jgi:hypothetical protein
MVSRYRDIIESNQSISVSSTSSTTVDSQQQQQHIVTPKTLNRSAKVAAQINAAQEKQQQNQRSDNGN